ncbi:MAG: flagellar biosynthesis anti-sigma factor FlgM [Cetobacterium sp.]
MNIKPVNFRSIENVYKSTKIENKPINPKNSDRIEISELGKYLNEVNKGKEDMNLDKVNDIKQRIENGTYSVDSKEVAKKILEHLKGEL